MDISILGPEANKLFNLIKRLIKKISTIPRFKLFIKSPHCSSYICFTLTAIFLHGKLTICFNFEREKFCLQFLRMRVNIHFSPLFQDDAVIWKNVS